MKHHQTAVHENLELDPTLQDVSDAFEKLPNFLRISSPQLSDGLDSGYRFVNWLLETLNTLSH